ncbi:MAG: NINE protein [Bacteroidales bacterium]
MKHEFEKYCHNCGAIIDKRTEVCPKCGASQTINQNPVFYPSDKVTINTQWLITLLLCVFLGVFGVHRFYNGHYLTGFLQLITAGGLGIWYLIDLVFIILGQFRDKEGNYIRIA